MGGFALVWVASRAWGSPLAPQLTVERSAEALDCPETAELLARIERILKRPLPEADAPAAMEPLHILVRFAKRSARYSAALTFSGSKTGERHLSDPGGDCKALADAVSVMIALSLDQQDEQPAMPASTRAPKSTPSAAPSGAARPGATPPPTGRAVDLGAAIECGPAFGFGGLATFALAEHIFARFWRSWRFDIGVNAIFATSVDSGAGRVRTSWHFASARGCYVLGGDYSAGPCALFGAGRVRGVGVGYPESRSDDLMWSALGAGLLAQGPLFGRVVGGLSGTLWLPLRSLTFSVENTGVVWRSPPVAGAVSLTLGVHFW